MAGDIMQWYEQSVFSQRNSGKLEIVYSNVVFAKTDGASREQMLVWEYRLLKTDSELGV